jgi:hypothetical protein
MNKQPIEYKQDSFDEYFSKQDHISSLDIKNFLRSPKYYYYEKYEKVQKESNLYFNLNEAFYKYLHERKSFDKIYAIMPKFDRRTRDGKAGFDLFELENEGKIIISENDMQIVKCLRESIIFNHTFLDLLTDSVCGVSYYLIDEITGLKLRLRPDIISLNNSSILDLKVSYNSSLNAVKNNLTENHYYISSAFYSDYLVKDNYIFCNIEQQQPYQLSLFVLNNEIIQQGRTEYRMALDLIKWSYDNNFWCDYNQFHALKECYKSNNMGSFFDINNSADMISIIY